MCASARTARSCACIERKGTVRVMAVIIDGKAVSAKVRREIADKVAGMRQKPGLAVIIVGEDPASKVYVRNKAKGCAEVGFYSEVHELPESVPEGELLALIDRLNSDGRINGILVQLPLPPHLDEKSVINRISPEKDVDAFHPINVGKMMIGEPSLLPCTPAGVMRLLREYGISPEGKRCVVLGRSNIVGKPQAMLLLRANGTVTVCHSRTPELKEECRRADILVVAIGRAKFITSEYVKPGATVIDVGMDRDENGKLCGDVDFEGVKEIAGAITPVPGGVGPMTIAMLLENTLRSAEIAQNREACPR